MRVYITVLDLRS